MVAMTSVGCPLARRARATCKKYWYKMGEKAELHFVPIQHPCDVQGL